MHSTFERTHTRFGALALLALLSYPCEEITIISLRDAGAPTDGGGDETDGGTMDTVEQLRYTPDGCEYEVATPQVRQARRGPESPTDADFGAEPFADHVHVGIGGDAATSFNVNWRSDEETLASMILYGTDEAAVGAADGAEAGVLMANGHYMYFDAVIEDILNPDGRVRVHEAHVCGLEAGTTYYYKVGGPGHWSQVFDTSTAPTQGTTEPWSFVASGDSRNNVDNAWPIAMRRVYEHGADLQVFSGDAVFLGALQPNWDEFFEAHVDDFTIQDLLSRVPLMVSNGNHDALSINYVTQFALPQEESERERGQGEEWYSFDYGNAHFVVLNDTVIDESVIGGSQAQWLRRDLAAVDRNATPWVFAVHHQPFYTCFSNHAPKASLRTAWQPIFDEFEVDIVFTGHNHVYERSRPIRGLQGGEGIVASAGGFGVPVYGSPGSGSGAPSGTIYLVSAGVGAPLYGVSDECATTETASAVPNYTLVEIEDRELHLTVYNPNDETRPIDEITLSK